MTWTLIQPASNWMYWVGHTPTPFWSVLSCHLCFPILNKIIVVCAPPMLADNLSLLNSRAFQCSLSRYALVIHSYHMSNSPSQQSLLSLSMSSILCCPVLTLTSSFSFSICAKTIFRLGPCWVNWMVAVPGWKLISLQSWFKKLLNWVDLLRRNLRLRPGPSFHLTTAWCKDAGRDSFRACP